MSESQHQCRGRAGGVAIATCSCLMSVPDAGRRSSCYSCRRVRASGLPEVSPGPPRADGDRAPGDQRRDEGRRRLALHERRKDQSEADQSNASQGRSGSIERGCLLATPVPAKPGLTLAPLLVFLDQGCARAKDRGQRQKQASDRRSKGAADQSGEDGRRTSQHEADEIFIPAPVLEGGKGKLYDHVLGPMKRSKPRATSSHRPSAARVAGSAFQWPRIRSWQTRML